jgi:hypothetical protein
MVFNAVLNWNDLAAAGNVPRSSDSRPQGQTGGGEKERN